MENQIKGDIKSEQPLTDEFIFSKNNNIPTTITEIVESREQDTPQILEILPNIKDFYISFINPYNTNQTIDYTYNENDNDIIEQNKKIKLRKKDLYKIFKMIKIPKDEINPYILFSFTSIKSEIITNTLQTYKIDFTKLQKLINNYYIQLRGKEDNIEINQKSIKKIFDLLDRSPNERLSFMQFYEVDEEIEYEEEEDEEENEEISDKPLNKKKNIIIKKKISNKENKIIIEKDKRKKINKNKYKEDDNNSNNNSNSDSINNKENINNNYKIVDNKIEDKKSMKKPQIKNVIKNKKNTKPKKVKNNAKIKIIGGIKNKSEKLEPSSLDTLKNIIDNIPSLLEKLKNKDKNKNKNKTNLKPKKYQNKKYKVINQQPNKRQINKNKNIYKDNESENNSSNNSFEKPREENNYKNNNKDELEPDLFTENKIPKYPFILPSSPEYENCKMYIVGSIPALGNWNHNLAIPMDEEIKNGQKYFTKYLEIKENDFPFEYKYIYNKNGKIIWLGKPKINHKAYPEYFHLYQNILENNNILSIFDLNIRYLNKVDGLNIWDNRKQKLLQLILKYIPDILFFQEITRPQYEFLEQNLNSIYENVGIYRDNTDHSEKCSISFNKIKYTLIDWGQFWLSSTPYIPGSNDFGNFFPRICTWALLKKINGEQFLFFNIHLDHVNFKAHLPCINVVLNESEKILKNFSETKTIFLGGCFYCEEDDELIYKLKEYGYNEVIFENTFHDFTGDADRHWDYLFWKEINNEKNDLKIHLKDALVPKKDSTIDLRNQQYISDHYPVIAEFIFENKNTNIDINTNTNNNNDSIFENPDEKKEFSEMDEEDNLRHSEEFEEYEDNDENNNNDIKNNDENNDLLFKNSDKNNNNNENNNDEENEEVEVIEVEEEIEDNENNKKDEKNINDKNENEEIEDNIESDKNNEKNINDKNENENENEENEKEKYNESKNEELEEEIEQEEETEKEKNEEIENEEQEEEEEEKE